MVPFVSPPRRTLGVDEVAVSAVRPGRDERSTPRRIGRTDLAFVGSLCGLLLWIVLATVWSGAGFRTSAVYLAAPLSLGIGVLVSRWAVRRGAEAAVSAVAATVLIAVVVSVSFYSNAVAAAGIQLVALSGLLLVRSAGSWRSSRAETARMLLAAVLGVLGVLLAARSQAASLLALLLVVVIVLVVRRRLVISWRMRHGVGLGSIGAAILAVLFLGAAPVWPWWLAMGESLSWARQELWRDALALWRENPLVGGGPGSFYAFSEISRSEEHLYAVHSSVLQVAAELGAIGVLLFLGLLVTGVFVAGQGARISATIGVTAWCALGIHSMIDHLYEFPLVCLLAGLVLGWAGSRSAAGAVAGPELVR